MPLYEYYCENCRRAIAAALSIGEHDKGVPTCPQCNGKHETGRSVDAAMRGGVAPYRESRFRRSCQ